MLLFSIKSLYFNRNILFCSIFFENKIVKGIVLILVYVTISKLLELAIITLSRIALNTNLIKP